MPEPARRPGTVTVVSGPTAVGKGTVCARLRDLRPDVWLSVSATTRPARPGEIDGVHYHFIDDAEFDRLVETGQMLEWAVVHKVARYGTPRGPVAEAVRAGRDVILEIDLQGARQVAQSWPDAVLVFLMPPSWDEMERRLVGRGTENAEERARRLDTAREELQAVDEFDHVVVNDTVGQAVDDLIDLMGLPALPIDTSSDGTCGQPQTNTHTTSTSD